MNWNIREFLWRNFVPQPPPPPEEDLPEGPLWIGWVLFFSIVFLGLRLALTGNGPWALIYFSAAAFYFLVALNTVKEPEEAILYSLGRAHRKLKKGWWLTLWPFHDVEIETTARQILHKKNPEREEQELYYIDGKRKIAIRVKMRVFMRLVNLRGSLNTYGGLNTEASRSDIEATAFAALRSALGHQTFAELLKNKGSVEREVERLTNAEINNLSEAEETELKFNPNLLRESPELARSGYLIESVDIYDYDERVQSEASRIRELAAAKAYEAGSVARAVAEPLRGNLPAAIAQSVSTVATTVRDINRDRTEAQRQEKKESTSTTTPAEETTGLLGRFQELLTERK